MTTKEYPTVEEMAKRVALKVQAYRLNGLDAIKALVEMILQENDLYNEYQFNKCLTETLYNLYITK